MQAISAPRLAAASLAACALLAGVSPAFAFSDDEARQAILQLRQQMQTVQNAQVQLANQLDALREQNRALTGQIEELRNGLSRQQRAAKDINERLVTVLPQQVTVDGLTFEASADERRAFDDAVALFSKGQYDDCAKAFTQFLAQYPQSGYKPSAQYWLGNSLFAVGNLNKALTVQTQLISQYPDFQRVPEAMLSKASTLASLGRRKDAAWTLRQLKSKYPNSDAAKVADERLKVLK